MKNDQNSNGFEAMQQAFGAFAPLRAALGENSANYWRNQDKILDSMQEFARGWFERRHEAAKSALDAARCSCEANSPADVVRGFQAWMMGSMQRVAADGLACQKHLMAMAELAGAPVERREDREAKTPRRASADLGKSAEEHAKAA